VQVLNYELHNNRAELIVLSAEGLAIDDEARLAAHGRLGMLTPSSNTVLEPMTAAILAQVPGVTAHFSRLRVTEIAVSDAALAQFDVRPMLEAGAMLADARPQAIVWNGTSGGWRGLDADKRLAETLSGRFGVPASTVTLALVEFLRTAGARHLSFVTPYTADVQARIAKSFEVSGFRVAASPCLGISENFAFSEVSTADMDRLVETAAAAKPDVIIPFCTNLPATRHAVRWERQFGIPVYDSISVAARAGLQLAGLSPGLITGWGSIFSA
jgi:maleate isomerase